ncbi:MAG: ferrochelatase [Alphaproteobacteria bacterium]|jgi:protoporphyrin/coproporphyrin ferrochelatase|nr:ferrochelatase [Alphaproteobacteria bacterium]
MSEPHALPPGHPPLPGPKIGVLLLNLGTPDATDYWSMRRYLSEFLSDKRIIELPKLLWQPILQGIILTVRPKKSGHAYAQIWNKELNESPLRTTTRDLTEKTAALLQAKHPNLMVDWAMRYGQPSTGDAIRRMIDAGCDRLLLVPLYPQYSAATTATACDQAFRQLMQERWQPAVRTALPWFDHPDHIDLLAKSVEAHYASLDWTPDVLIASFHGLPKEYFDKGDPYHCHCAKTARLLRERLGWPEDKLVMAFQSRFGPKEWLQPYADETIRALPGKGAKNVAMISPGFVADCVETLEELAIGLREEFLEAGGENFAYVPCLNDDDGQAEFMANLAERELGGWL